MTHEDNEELHAYGDPGIVSGNAPVTWWLKLTYLILPFIGMVMLFSFWNGSGGWFDRGYWFELERAANTTFPLKNYQEDIDEKKEENVKGKK